MQGQTVRIVLQAIRYIEEHLHEKTVRICFCFIAGISIFVFLFFHHSCYVFKSSSFTPILLSMPLSILRLHAPIETADAQPPYPSQEHRGNFLLNLCSSQDRAGNPIFQDIRYPIVFTFSVLYPALCKAGISAVPAVSELENVLSDSFSFG